MLRKTTLHTILLNSLLGFVILWGPAVSADPVDAVADVVLGQPNFTSNTGNSTGINASSLWFPIGGAVDAAGNVYVADSHNNRVLVYFDPFGTDMVADFVLGQPDFTSGVGGNTGGLSVALALPVNVTVDTAGNVYVADSFNHRVVVYLDPLNTDKVADFVLGQPDLTSNTPNNGGISASSLFRPQGVAVDANGNVYVVDGNNRVLVYRAPIITGMEADVVFGKTNFTTGGCNLVDTTGINFPGTANSLCAPRDIAIDTADNVYITDLSNHRVLAYIDPMNTDTMADEVFGSPDFVSSCGNCSGVSASSLARPRSVAVDAADNLYVSDFGNNRVLVYHTPLTTDTVADVVLGQLDFVSGIANNGGVSASGLRGPVGVMADTVGNVYVVDTENHRVLGYSGVLAATTVLTCIGYDAPFATPLALKKKTKRTIPLKMALANSNGGVITDADVSAPPVVNVLFGGQVYGEVPPDSDDLLPNGGANDDNIFRFDDSTNQWVYNLDSKQFAAPGVYTVKPVAGDDSYTISTGTGCLQTFERLN